MPQLIFLFMNFNYDGCLDLRLVASKIKEQEGN